MRYNTNGRLLLLSKLKEKYNVSVEGDTGILYASIKIYGVGEPVEIKVYFNVVEHEYAQLVSRKVTYTSAPLGEDRMYNLNYALQKQFYANEAYLAPLRLPFGYVYAEHHAFHMYRRGDPTLQLLKKTSLVNLELLATDTVVGKDAIVYRYFYDKTHNVLLERIDSGETKTEWNASTKEVFIKNTADQFDCTTFYFDEHNALYQSRNVEDKDNLRLFKLVKESGNYEMQSLRNHLYDRLPDLNFQEMIVAFNNLREGKVAPIEVSEILPFSIGNLTIHSQKVVGEPIPSFAPHSWVEIEGGRLAIIVSANEDQTTYDVCIEGDYAPDERNFRYDELTAIPEQNQALGKPKLIKFTNDNNHYPFYGYGYAYEETPNFYKVKPLSITHANVAETYRNKLIKGTSFRFKWRSQINELISRIHGLESFVFIPKTSTSDVTPEKQFEIDSFFDTKVRSAHSNAIMNLLILSDLDIENMDYFHVELLSLSEYLGFEALVEQLTTFMVRKTYRMNFTRDLVQWVDKTAIKKRFFKTS